MTSSERLQRWNGWFDRLPQEWRFQAVLWLLIAVGALNMLLTIAIGFPFALLLLVGILCLAVIRAPYVLGWIVPAETVPSSGPNAWKFEIGNADWLIDVNRRYDAMPEFKRVWLVVAILLVAGAINMVLTIDSAFPFGLLLLLVLLALVVVRAPYVGGVLKPSRPDGGNLLSMTQHDPGLAHSPSPALLAEPGPVQPTLPASPVPSDGMPRTGPGRSRPASATDARAAAAAAPRMGNGEDSLGSSAPAEEVFPEQAQNAHERPAAAHNQAAPGPDKPQVA